MSISDHLSLSWIKFNIRKYYLKFKYPVRIIVKWPVGEVMVGPNSKNHDGVYGGAWYQLVESSDPNDHYRPVLEKYVGRQRVDWDWGHMFIYSEGTFRDEMEIMFKKKHEKLATYYKLLWG